MFIIFNKKLKNKVLDIQNRVNQQYKEDNETKGINKGMFR